MRSLKQSLTALALILGLAITIKAGDTSEPKVSEAPQDLKNQVICPVMGGKIDSTLYTDIQGQRVYHCCPMCSAKLKADPDKYFKKAAEQGVLFENIQTTCPVSGEELDNKSVFIDYEGRRIAFCCNKCVSKFKENPTKYLSNLDEDSSADSGTMEKMDHSDHN